MKKKCWSGCPFWRHDSTVNWCTLEGGEAERRAYQKMRGEYRDAFGITHEQWEECPWPEACVAEILRNFRIFSEAMMEMVDTGDPNWRANRAVELLARKAKLDGQPEG